MKDYEVMVCVIWKL